MNSNGAALTAFQNDIAFPAQALPLAADGARTRPECVQNPDLLPGHLAARFGFPGFLCPISVDCLVRAIVSVSEASFPDGAVVTYTCTVEVAPDAELGSYAVRCENLATTDPSGQALPGTCADGAIVVVSDPPPTAAPPPPTPEPSPQPTASGPLPCEDCPVLEIGSASGQPGDRVSVDVRLRTAGRDLSGVQSDIGFAPEARIAARADGHPDCTYGPNLAGFSSLEFQPAPCGHQALDTCTAIRILLFTADLSSLPDGALLLSCGVEISADAAAGTYALQPMEFIGASTPAGREVDLATISGSITVDDGKEGQQPATGGTDAGPPAAAAGGGGGCAIAPAASAGTWWLVGAALIVVGRRLRRR